MKLSRLFALWCLSVCATLAQPGPDAQTVGSAERARIAAQRASLEAAFKADEAVCQRRFFVNRCLAGIRQGRNEALADLRRQELLLDEADRKQKAADQLLKLEKKAADQQQQEAAVQAQNPRQESASLTGRAASSAPASGQAADVSAAAAEQARQARQQSKSDQADAQQARAAANAQATRERLAKAAQRKADHERRLQESSAPKGKALPASP